MPDRNPTARLLLFVNKTVNFKIFQKILVHMQSSIAFIDQQYQVCVILKLLSVVAHKMTHAPKQSMCSQERFRQASLIFQLNISKTEFIMLCRGIIIFWSTILDAALGGRQGCESRRQTISSISRPTFREI
jgi:hypothetical protein